MTFSEKSIASIESDTLKLHFHPGQLRAWNSKKRFIFILAGTQSGKTSFGPWWLLRELQSRGKGDYLAVTANYDLFKLKMLPEIRKVFEHTLKIGRFWTAERILEIADPNGKFLASSSSDPMWARIILRSAVGGSRRADVGVSSLESSTAKAAWIDECGLPDFSAEAYDAILRRLSLSQGRLLGTTTLYNVNWLKSKVYIPFLKGDPDIDVIQFDSLQNPAFPREEYERAKRALPAWKFDMLYRGRFARPAGMIFADFDEALHIVKPFTIPHAWPRYVGIDPGPLHTASVWLAERPAPKSKKHPPKFYVYRVTLEGNLTTQQHAQLLLERSKHENITKFVGGARSELQFRLDYRAAGIQIARPPFTDVEAGIDRIVQLLRERRLFFFENCELRSPHSSTSVLPTIFDELNQYARKLGPDGEPTIEIENKEQFHRIDALRYAISIVSQPASSCFFSLPNRRRRARSPFAAAAPKAL